MKRVHVLAIVSALSACGRSETQPSLSANDVSVMFPDAPAELLWPASLPGLGGPLLPKPEFDRIEISVAREVEDAEEYDALRVVSLRFDPCFRAALDGPCQPQIRLVFQMKNPAGGFFDGAVHALYALSEADFTAVVKELSDLARLAPENAKMPLGPSPALTNQGVDGPYGRGLKALVTRYVGARSLVRMTFMSRTFARSGQWQFGGFVTGQGKLTIAGIGATQQNVTRNLGDRFDVVVQPPFGDASGRLGASAAAMAQAAPSTRAELHAFAERQADPTATLPDTTDCAACHVADHVTLELERLDPGLVSDAVRARRAPKARGGAEDDLDNLRAFGWIGPHPHVSQRTANETAAVLGALR